VHAHGVESVRVRCTQSAPPSSTERSSISPRWI
jgi:hypothetical protein